MKRQLLALFLVVSLVTAGATAPVSAGTDFGGDWVKEMGWMVTFPVFGDLLGWNQNHEDVDSLHKTNNATHLDLYDGLVGQKYQYDNLVKTLNSYTQDSRTFAFVKAENATIQEIQAGTAESGVNTSARGAVHDYYTESQQQKFVDGVSIALEETSYVSDRAANTSGLNRSDVVEGIINELDDNADSYTTDYAKSSANVVGVSTANVTAANGSTIEVTAVTFEVIHWADWDGGSTTLYSEPLTVEWNPVTTVNVSRAGVQYYDASDDTAHSTRDMYVRMGGVRALPPDGSSLTPETVVDFDTTRVEWDDTGSTSTMVADNADVYASALYDAKQNGTLDAANYTSPYVLAQEYATDYNSTGYWSYAIAMLSSTGTATPDLNQTSVMNVEYNGVTHEGLVMASQFPNGTLEAGVTYDGLNTTAFGERAWLVTTAGERLQLDGQFTVKSMTDQQGNAVNVTKEVVYTYEGVNMTDYRNQQKLIKELMVEIQEREPAGSGGSGSDSGIPREYILLAVVALAGAAMMGGKK